jgi:prepilin-type processing-associated H-X9-DG protein
MRLTIVNLVISGAYGRGTERSAGILARNSGKMNPLYPGHRIAAGAGYKVGAVKETRWASSHLSVLVKLLLETPTPNLPASGGGRRRVNFLWIDGHLQ